ncbi:MAG TPA: hypothetical protein VLG66_18610 [Alphaproteobacteria bacterium]|jgi:hypothetical protein|nr:hypothetical protein [Alphaproteobacteria bacterium]
MDLEAFKRSTAGRTPPPGLAPAIEALWWDAKGDWTTAHDRAQAQEDKQGAWVHAYLHRKEGDLANAGYWYRQAGKPAATGAFEIEWEAIVRALLR